MIYLLDTNILIAYLRNNDIAILVNHQFAPFGVGNDAVICVVSVGEIKSIAESNSWGEKRMQLLDSLFSKILVADINSHDVIQRYAAIDAYSQGRLSSHVSNFTARNMGKNDIWIAAVAAVLNAELITTDKDFAHLHNTFLSVNLITT